MNKFLPINIFIFLASNAVCSDEVGQFYRNVNVAMSYPNKTLYFNYPDSELHCSMMCLSDLACQAFLTDVNKCFLVSHLEHGTAAQSVTEVYLKETGRLTCFFFHVTFFIDS